MKEMLPGWFSERMTTDHWLFGLMVSTGQIIVITHIEKIYQAQNGSVWIDVELARFSDYAITPDDNWYFAPTTRVSATINANHIVAAFDLMES